MSVFLSIDYDTVYKAVVVTSPMGVPHRFETGDPICDYMRAVVCAMALSSEHKRPIMMTSSVHDFVCDVPGYRFNAADLLEGVPSA